MYADVVVIIKYMKSFTFQFCHFPSTLDGLMKLM